ncbi:hypothetical protein Cgig2_010680 [Carnegiea gigantea]|uniref:BHLH domain-containing protein n=1 Tax=Carnegiea gigantea TaxID=171969 RepID=A0A9Q1KMG9_9CARY|nr:hypothetical protein Cgig2_010680 [Carnegiea gigantea]
MEDFTSDFHKVLKPATSFSELNTNMELMFNNFSELNQPQSSHVHGLLDYFSSDTGFSNSPNTLHPPYSNELLFLSAGSSSSVHHDQHRLFRPFDHAPADVPQSLPSFGRVERHEKNAAPMSEFLEMPSSPGFESECGGGNISTDKNTNNTGAGRKRKGKSEEELQKPREVIHVRAKRGQATDSHSLAERVRRERINEKLKVLQDLVPGCYKTMGMAVMLDVIINYVRSLQNQIEFLSMKLSAASLFYDFNSPEAEIFETLRRTANSYEAHQEMEREGYGGVVPRVQSTWPF